MCSHHPGYINDNSDSCADLVLAKSAHDFSAKVCRDSLELTSVVWMGEFYEAIMPREHRIVGW